ncbi:O-antigen ligase family protein [Erythrobacter sp. R86502]|uniref:O-antigen ligase family protein n=1 Tax=Erythrobacter sp. R86502 TaxID=3093846 RepID=UPI0036D365B2
MNSGQVGSKLWLEPANAEKPMSRRTRIVLIGSVFFSGWALVRIGQINLTLSDIFLIIVFLTMLIRGQLNARPFGQFTPYWYCGLGVMLLGLMIGSIAHNSLDRFLIVGAQYLFGFLLVPMVFMGQQMTFMRSLVAVFVFGIAVSNLLGVSASLLFEQSDVAALMGRGFVAGNGRVGAMTGEVNWNGAMVAFAVPMLIYSVQRRIMPSGIGIACGAILIWGMLASGSFTGFSATILAVSAYLVISGFGLLIRVALLGTTCASLFLVSGLPLPQAFEDRVAGAVTSGDLNEAGTFTDRSVLIKEAWGMTEDHIVVGLGVDRLRRVSGHRTPVHEFHLLIWNEGGFLAFCGVIVLLLTMFGIAFLAASRSRNEGALILASVVVFNIYTFSIPHMFSRIWILPVLLAMSTYLARRPNISSPDTHPGPL